MSMTYEESFLVTADAEGNVPVWALNQIFSDHSLDIDEFTDNTDESEWFNGEVILNWLGY